MGLRLGLDLGFGLMVIPLPSWCWGTGQYWGYDLVWSRLGVSRVSDERSLKFSSCHIVTLIQPNEQLPVILHLACVHL